ncbi:type 1 glutamine amidotransferase [Levilactobacillus angrenensis]|uniref:Type 1 glutamine amidotransferase n=2 Tax=Levilactobacillus TaxID=2767886 RepID=A0ABW1UCY3_9LACO|nr:type 1 glutamine amidotransferase [Levilactobacillus angrenensis]
MRVNVLQQTPDEGPGAIQSWANANRHELYIYHPAEFGQLPTADQTDMLVILGGPMSPNDELPWIKAERQLIQQLLTAHKPIFGVCFGAQQIVKQLGGAVHTAPAKEVGWAPVTRQSTAIPGVPAEVTVLHWHEEMFDLPASAQLLFSSAHLRNQGFLLGDNVIGLQFHLEPLPNNVREMVVNDGDYATGSVLGQTPQQILAYPESVETESLTFRLLDFITKHRSVAGQGQLS